MIDHAAGTGPGGVVPDHRRWRGTKPTWSQQRAEGVRAVSRSIRARRDGTAAHPPIAECVFGPWLRAELEAGRLHPYPLDERPRVRAQMPPGAKWSLTLWHREAMRVFVLGQFGLGAKRRGGLIIDQEELGLVIGCGRTKAGRLMRELVKWNLLECHPRSRPAQDGRGRWRTANRYTLTSFAVQYFDLRGHKSRTRITGTRDPNAVVPAAAQAPTPAAAGAQVRATTTGVVNPDGTRPANPEVAFHPAKRSLLRREPSEDCERRADMAASAPPTSFSDSHSTAVGASPALNATRVKTRTDALLASNEAGLAKPPLVDEHRRDAKLQPPVPPAPRRTLDDDNADAMSSLMARFGELTPAELEAIAFLRRGGKS